MHPLPTDGVLDHEQPDMTSYRTQPIDEFLSGIASRRVTPAGGSASAVSGAIGDPGEELVDRLRSVARHVRSLVVEYAVGR